MERAFLVLHESKWDVPRYFGTGEIAGVSLAYLSIPGSRSVPETLDRAFPFVEDSLVALGFPDVIFEPVDAYAPLIARQAATGADLVLGLFPAANPRTTRTTDMVELGEDGRVLRVEVRPETTALRSNWLIAVWSPVFTRFLPCGGGESQELRREPGRRGGSKIGAVVRSAVAAGLHVQGVGDPPAGTWRDVGTLHTGWWRRCAAFLLFLRRRQPARPGMNAWATL